MTDVLVVSCERSGTHLMIDTLKDSFGLSYKSASSDIDDMKRNLALPDKMKEAIEVCLEDSKGNKILKSHHPFCFFEPIWDWITERMTVFYVSRDGRAVMASQWNHFRVMDVGNLGPVTFSVGQFMRASPDGTLATRYHGDMYPANMLARWMFHIVSWRDGHKANYLSYEDDHMTTLQTMGAALGRKPRTDKKPLVGGVTPWRGKKDTWKESFTGDDLEYFWSNAGYTMSLLGIDQHEEATESVNVQA